MILNTINVGTVPNIEAQLIPIPSKAKFIHLYPLRYFLSNFFYLGSIATNKYVW